MLRGRVLNQVGNPLGGVTVTILNHPEFGETHTRADGQFDLAVNGGGLLNVKFDKEEFASAQRQVNAAAQDYTMLPDVALSTLDSKATTVLSEPARRCKSIRPRRRRMPAASVVRR